MPITARQAVLIAGAIGRCPRTIERLYDGRDVRLSTYLAVADAARKLGLPEPPTPQPAEAETSK